MGGPATRAVVEHLTTASSCLSCCCCTQTVYCCCCLSTLSQLCTHTQTSKVAEKVSQEEEREPVVRCTRSQNALVSASSLVSMASKQNAAAGAATGTAPEHLLRNSPRGGPTKLKASSGANTGTQLQLSRLGDMQFGAKPCTICVRFWRPRFGGSSASAR